MKLSVLDLSSINPGETRHDALSNSVKFAQDVEKLGYYRFWVAEHHASHLSAGRVPEVLIPLIAAKTNQIRVGSGAVLLNHYSVYKVAETFCTLNEMFPERIDLGVGRASNGPILDNALQQIRNKKNSIDSSQQILELCAWLDNSFPSTHPYSEFPIHTINTKPEIHILGKSLWSVHIAAQTGLRYVYGAFFNQESTRQIFNAYFQNFTPSERQSGVTEPEIAFGTNIVCADSEEEARRQLAPIFALNHKENLQSMLLPDEAVKVLGYLPKLEQYQPESGIPPRYIAGTFEQVQEQLFYLKRDLGFNEIIIRDIITDYDARLHSFNLISKMFK